MNTECIVCGSNIELPDDVETHEIIMCDDCGTDLEVTSVAPLSIQAAPEEEEDWGE